MNSYVDICEPSSHLNHVAAFGVRCLRPTISICKICPAMRPRRSSRESYVWWGTFPDTMNKKICGVYAWEHVPTGMLYIGSSIDCEKRKQQHPKKGGHFHRRATGLGWEKFTFRILEECPPEARLELEREWIQRMNSIHPYGFNIQKDPTRYRNNVWTDEMRAEASKRLKGSLNTAKARAEMVKRLQEWHEANPEAHAIHAERMRKRFCDPGVRAAHSARLKTVLGTSEARSATSLRMKLYFADPDAREANSIRQKIVQGTPEARKAASIRQKIIQGTPEARKAAALRAKKQFSSPEARAAMSTRRKVYYSVNKSPLCKTVNQYTKDGIFIASFESQASAARSLGISQSNISKSARKGSNCGGFRWCFAGEEQNPKH